MTGFTGPSHSCKAVTSDGDSLEGAACESYRSSKGAALKSPHQDCGELSADPVILKSPVLLKGILINSLVC